MTKEVNYDLCYQHDGLAPVQNLTIYPCDWYYFWSYTNYAEGTVCELDIRSGKWAWPNETNLNVSGLPAQNTSTNNTSYASLYRKRTMGRCREVSNFAQNLNNGRTCQFPWQCKSQNCGSDGICHGVRQGSACN